MINFFLKSKVRRKNDDEVNLNDIKNADKILFALFTRYGDTIINIVVIREFVEHYPTKEYLVLCPKQMTPYINELAPKIRCIGINKRNYLDMFKLHNYLKEWKPDIGFNPWSFGFESSFFLTYTKKYKFYKNFKKPKIINHYAVVRSYLKLPERTWEIKNFINDFKCEKVLICPESTDTHRSITIEQLDNIISQAKENFGTPKLTIASIGSNFRNSSCESFVFKKTEESSRKFLELVKESDLIICVDSAPLHIAQALKKNVVAVFNTTAPENVLNSGSKLIEYKGKSLYE